MISVFVFFPPENYYHGVCAFGKSKKASCVETDEGPSDGIFYWNKFMVRSWNVEFMIVSTHEGRIIV